MPKEANKFDSLDKLHLRCLWDIQKRSTYLRSEGEVKDRGLGVSCIEGQAKIENSSQGSHCNNSDILCRMRRVDGKLRKKSKKEMKIFI